MASGKVHRQDSIGLAVVGGFLLGARGTEPLEFVVFALGALAGIILSPDLDVDHRTESERLFYRVGWLPGILFYGYWLPYALLIPHRHPVSHWPIVGTIGRLLYLLPLWGAAWTFTGFPPWVYTWAFVGGLMGSDTLHWLRDNLR